LKASFRENFALLGFVLQASLFGSFLVRFTIKMTLYLEAYFTIKIPSGPLEAFFAALLHNQDPIWTS
jgi:hypothetical protein